MPRRGGCWPALPPSADGALVTIAAQYAASSASDDDSTIMKRRLPRLALAFILAAPPLACGGGGVHAQEQRWDGTITLTHTFNGTEGGKQVSWTREERWENLVANAESADEFYASLDATWRVTDSRTEVGDPCTYTYEASGEAEYPWFSFDVNPMDEVSYRLTSGGTGSGIRHAPK